jgi:hypothetical protein
MLCVIYSLLFLFIPLSHFSVSFDVFFSSVCIPAYPSCVIMITIATNAVLVFVIVIAIVNVNDMVMCVILGIGGVRKRGEDSLHWHLELQLPPSAEHGRQR